MSSGTSVGLKRIGENNKTKFKRPWQSRSRKQSTQLGTKAAGLILISDWRTFFPKTFSGSDFCYVKDDSVSLIVSLIFLFALKSKKKSSPMTYFTSFV